MTELLDPRLADCRRIFLHEFSLDLSIGFHDFEREAPQRVIIDVDLFVPMAHSTALNDEVAEVLDYDFIRRGVIAWAQSRHFNLQETLLDRIVDLVDEGYDVALRLTRSPPDQVVAKALMPVRYRLCSTVNGKKGQKVETPADLAGHNCLHYGLREFGNEWRFQRGSEEMRVCVTSNVVVNNSEVVRDLLLADMGIGLVWNYAVARDIADGRLISLLPDWTPVCPFGQTAWAIWLPQTHLPPKIRVFVDFLAERLKETPA